jgi:5-carboxymethyl-2-hydroxymuconate isomerase
MNAGLALQVAMRDALLTHAPLTALLGGGHVFDELPRGAAPPHVEFSAIETRDWSVADQKAHEHFVQIAVTTGERSRAKAQAICDAIETRLDNAALTLSDHRLVNLRIIFWSVTRARSDQNFDAALRFRAATEPL